MTRFARAKGSKASNERKEEEATPWHIMKQQFMDLHNTSTLSNNGNCTSELKNLLQCDTTSGKEIWSDFGDINGNKVKTIPKKKIKGKHNKYPVELKEDRPNKRFKIDGSQEQHFHNEEGLKNQSKKSRPKSLKNRSCNVPVITNDFKETGPTGKFSKTTFKNKLKDVNVEFIEHHNVGKAQKTLSLDKIEPDVVPVTLSADNLNSIYKNKNKKISKVKENSNAKHILDDGSGQKHFPFASGIQNETSNSNRPILIKDKNKKNIKLKPKHCVVAAEVSQSKDLKETGNICDYEDQTTPSTYKGSGGKHVTVDSGDANKKNKLTIYNNWKNYSNLHTIIANGREIKVVNYEGFLIKKDDAIELKRLRKKLRAQNVTKEKINALLKLERRKAEKSLAREKKSVCFHCRKFGHNFTDCPDIKDSDLSKSGMCFKCGSMEHSHYDCKVLQSQSFRYAVCFVCKEQGHIARQCKMNPHGQYPKGGSCHLCGEITHLRKDCPKAETDNKPSNVLTVEKLSHNLIEDINTANETLPKTVKKRKTKLVTF